MSATADRNGADPDQLAEEVMAAFAQNSDVMARAAISNALGKQYRGNRDLYQVLGYERNPTIDDYYATYRRQDIARTIVEAPAKTCWRKEPEIIDGTEETDSAFQEDVHTLFDEYRLLHYLERADIVSGIGQFGVLFIGFTDGRDLEEEVTPGTFSSDAGGGEELPLDGLAYLAPFSERHVDVKEVELDPTNPRYGLPRLYEIEFEEGNNTKTVVHWTRVIHVADRLLESEVYGRSRLEGVLNRLFDLEKVVGGVAEMTWRGADRKFVISVDPSLGQVLDRKEFEKEFDEMIHNMRTAAYAQGTEIHTIEGEVADPSGIVDKLLNLIAGETGIPKRMLIGSERGELASTQDRATWLERNSERQTAFCEPQMFRPLIDRLEFYDVLTDPSEEDWEIEWPPLFELNEVEQAETMHKRAQALASASPYGDPEQLATIEEIREQILGWQPERGSETIVEVPQEEMERPVPEEAMDELIEDVVGRERRPDVRDENEPPRPDGGQ